MAPPKTLLVTGASGFVGRHLAAHWLARGAAVRGLVREPERARARGLAAALRLHRGALAQPSDSAAFDGADAVIHCAWAMSGRSEAEVERLNVEGSLAVRRAARRAGARFVFVSSLAARPGAASAYARAKLAVEAALDPESDLILQPGLVVAPLDGPAGGVFLRAARSLRRFRVAPLVAGGRGIVQPVHVEDLGRATEHALARKLTGVVRVADPEGIEMREFLRLLGQALGVRCVAVPIPYRPTLAVLRVAERLGLPLPLTSDNLIGQYELERVDCRADLARLGVTVRGARESLAAIAGPRSSGEQLAQRVPDGDQADEADGGR